MAEPTMPPPPPGPPPPPPVVIQAPAGSTVVVTTVPAAPAVVSGDGLVKVHIQTKELVTLEHRSGPGVPWQVACETPCDVRLPATDQYRVVGAGLNESEPFVLATPKGDTVKIHVAPGLRNREKIGEALTITGATLTVGALIVGLVAAEPSSVFQANGTTNNTNWNVIAVGTTIAVVGLGTGIFGGAWWYDNAHTRVAGDIQGDQPARGAAEPRYQTGMRSVVPNLQTYSATLFTASF
jgi:hypothetical protein